MSSEEKAFLHDIASPISIADVRVRSILKKVSEGAYDSDKQLLLESLQKLVGDIEKITDKLQARRLALSADSGAADGRGKGAT